MSAWILGAALVAGIGGALAHEATHWIAGRLVGRNPSVDWRALETRWRAAQPPAWPDKALAAAPVCVGATVACAAALARPAWPARWWFVIAIGWGVYTLDGDDMHVLRGNPMPGGSWRAAFRAYEYRTVFSALVVVDVVVLAAAATWVAPGWIVYGLVATAIVGALLASDADGRPG